MSYQYFTRRNEIIIFDLLNETRICQFFSVQTCE